MKRQLMKGFMALSTAIMMVGASSSLFVSCEKLNKIDSINEQINSLDERLKAIEALKGQLEALTARVDALYTLKFQVTDNNELQYSFDNGTTWVSTGVFIAEDCTKPEVSIVDNGDTVTITVGDQSFEVVKPEEIVFEIRAGKVYFASEATQTVNILTQGIEDLTVMAAPKGWYAEINAEGKIEITAPDYMKTVSPGYDDNWNPLPAEAAATGYVKVHACSSGGKCMVGKLLVEVSYDQIVVKAYGGTYEVSSTNDWGTVVYGVSTKDAYLAEAEVLLEAVANYNYDVLSAWEFIAEPTANGTLAEALGYEPKAGEEYVVWAFDLDAWPAATTDDLVLAFYTPTVVTVEENEAKRTPYDNYISIEVLGAEAYYALALNEELYTSYGEGYWESMMVENLMYGQEPGKKFTESYEGSLYQIAAGTQYYMGVGNPNSTGYLLLLPIDGRSADQYTYKSVFVYDFETDAIVAGGSVNVTAEQIESYTEYGQEVTLDPYTKLGVQITEPSGEWMYFYSAWMTEEEYAAANVDEAVMVSELLRLCSWPTSSDAADFPMYSITTVEPAQTKYFVAFYVDKDYKYGEIFAQAYTSDDVTWSDITLELESNLVNGELKNTLDLELTPTPSAEVSKYKYIHINIWGSNQYADMTAEELASSIHFSQYAEVVNASELVEGKFVISEHSYNSLYYVAVLAYDKDGNPASTAVAVGEYTPIFHLDAIEAVLANEPTVEFTIEEYEDMGSTVTDIFYTITPAEGTEVANLLLMSKEDLEHYADDLAIASALWGESLSAFYTYYDKVETTHYRTFYASGLTPVLLLSWKDAEGKYYYKAMDLVAE